LRVPVILSGLLLMVWFPLISRRPAPYGPDTALSIDVYLDRWLLITAVLFAAGAVAAMAAAARRRRRSRSTVRVS
jgi:cell division protein FtsX